MENKWVTLSKLQIKDLKNKKIKTRNDMGILYIFSKIILQYNSNRNWNKFDPRKFQKNYWAGSGGETPHAGTLYGKSHAHICELKTVPASGQVCNLVKSAINTKLFVAVFNVITYSYLLLLEHM
jgi:hypothetical protein